MKSENSLVLRVVALCVLVAGALFLGGGMFYGGMGGMMSGFYGGFGMGLFGWLFMVLVLVALILLITWLFKQIGKS